MWARHKAVIAVVAVVVFTGLVTGGLLALRGGTPARRVSLTPTPIPTPTPIHPVQLVSPFTGEPVPSLNRVLAVKIDNIVFARPQTGLTRADIVYVLPVEGGLSRFLVIFSSHYPRVIGPVRSAREDDLELLRQFGRPAFAYSGATAALLPYIHRHARIVDLYAHTKQLLAQSAGASKARDIGFRFGPPPPGGKAIPSASVSYPAASFRFTWSAARGRWLVSIDGARAMTTDGGRLAPATVVIQHTTVRTSRVLEYGSRPPYAQSVGSGTAVVLRDGKAWTVHWSRRTFQGGTTFTTASGQRMTFKRGQVMVVLAYR